MYVDRRVMTPLWNMRRREEEEYERKKRQMYVWTATLKREGEKNKRRMKWKKELSDMKLIHRDSHGLQKNDKLWLKPQCDI